MRTTYLLASLTAIALLPGCSSESGRAFSSADAAQIRSGVTDKATIERTVGPPYRRQIAADLNKGATLDPADVADASDGDGNPITVKTYNPKLTDRKNFKFHNA